MTLCVLDSDQLADLPEGLPHTPHAVISMVPSGRAYLTTVTTDIAGHTFFLYSETHAQPRIPTEVVDAVAAFNADPAEWARLVAEALDAEDQILEEDRDNIDKRVAQSRAIRRRLLGKNP